MTWRTRSLTVSDGILAIHERPPQPSGAPPVPLVLLHGFTGSGRDWETVTARLPAVHVLAPDLPGHGATTVRDAAFAASATAVLAAVDALGHGRFALAGYSMGGRLALQIALSAPERVERLLLESASPGIADPLERERRRVADESLADFAVAAGIDAFVDRWERTPVLAAEARLPADERAALRARRRRCRPAGLAASLRGMGTGAQPWLGDRLTELTMPVHIVAGGADAKFCAIAREILACVRNAHLEIVDGAGHNVHLERPQRFAEILQAFLCAESKPARHPQKPATRSHCRTAPEGRNAFR